MARKVERTQPGSKLDWRVTYDSGNKKWTNDRPGDGKGDPEERKNLFDDLTVQRGIDRLEKAIVAYAHGRGHSKVIKNAVELFEQYAGVEAARTAVRAIHKAVKGKDEAVEKGAEIAKTHVNRNRKASVNPYLNTSPTKLKRDIENEDDRARKKLMKDALNAWKITVPGPFRKGNDMHDIVREMDIIRELKIVGAILAEVGDIEIVEPVGSRPIKQKQHRKVDDNPEDD